MVVQTEPMVAGTTHVHLDRERCRRALEARDRRFDGRFIVGVTSTGIYCRPSCPTPVHPKPENTMFFPTTAAAQLVGLRACKRCQPDASPGSPEWDRRNDLVGRAVRLIEEGEVDRSGVEGLATRLAVGPRHLRRVLQHDLGAGPIALARAQRAQTARILIETTDLSMSDLAFAAGFGSVRQFNSTITEVFAVSPTVLRESAQKRKGRKATGPDAVVGTDDSRLSLHLRLPFREPLALETLFAWLAKRAFTGVAVGDATMHRRALRLPHGDAIATFTNGRDHVACHLELASLKDLPAARAACRRLLDLDADPVAIAEHLSGDPVLAQAIRATPGMRVPGTVDGFETAIFAIVGQQRSIGAAVTLTGRLAAAARPPVDERPLGDDSPASEDVLRPFPAAQEILDADLSGLGFTKRNISTVRAVAELVATGELDLTTGADREETRARLLAVHGIGPWTADYIGMRALGDPDISLPGDLVIRKVAATNGIEDLTETSHGWRPWRSYATHLLWTLTPPVSSSEKS